MLGLPTAEYNSATPSYIKLKSNIFYIFLGKWS